MIDRAKSLIASIDAWAKRHAPTRITRRAVIGFLNHEALQYGGSMAYFSVLSMFQLLVLGIVVGSFIVGEGQARDFVVEQVTAGSPLDEATVTGIIDSAIESRGAMTIISFAFLLWSALGIFSALSNGINRVFENAPKRPFWQDKLIGLLLMAMAGLLVVASLVIGIVTGILQRAAEGVLNDLPGGGTVVWLIGLLAPLILIFLAFWLIYKVVPNRPTGWMEILPGAIVAAVLWTLLRFGFTWYATSVANYESAFGPISTAITLLVFLYFASLIVLLGAEFARASTVDDEIGAGAVSPAQTSGGGDVGRTADPRFLPVPVDPPPAPAGRVGPRLPRPVWIGAAAAAGLLIGRLTKRSDDDW